MLAAEFTGGYPSFGFAENTDDLFVGKTLLHGDVLMWLMKTLLTSGCTNQRGAGHPAGDCTSGAWTVVLSVLLAEIRVARIFQKYLPVDCRYAGCITFTIWGQFGYRELLYGKPVF